MTQKNTLKERLWKAVKFNAGATAVQLARILKHPNEISISPALATMRKQGYFYSFGLGTRKDPQRWYTDQDAYIPVKERTDLKEDHNCKKVLPKNARQASRQPTLHQPMVALMGFSTGENKPAGKVDQFVSDLTIGEAQQLYLKLHGYFGPKLPHLSELMK